MSNPIVQDDYPELDTPEQAKYRFVDVACCYYCEHSDWDYDGAGSCPKLKLVCGDGETMPGNSIQPLGICRHYAQRKAKP